MGVKLFEVFKKSEGIIEFIIIIFVSASSAMHLPTTYRYSIIHLLIVPLYSTNST